MDRQRTEAVDRQRTDRQLRLIAETVRIADALGVDLWLRGGWAMEFFLKQGEESSFALLDEDGSGHVVVAGGPWAGERWPDGMLEGPLGRIGATACPVISPAAQIEIKRMTPVWIPGRPRRAEDAEDIRVLETALRDAGGGPDRERPGGTPR
ncbi:aminoglycoside adenylyltransferase [Streptomyces sp. NPDC012389]|uniref:aminoglycoside adenylyltransferase n=1 Tax=Streptomyces sp. NPDC012389 TaxID=3364830 RepID=UPI0036E4C5B4